MPRINEAMDTDLTGLKGLSNSAGQRLVERRGGYIALSAGVCAEHKFVISGIEDNGLCL